MAGSSRSFQRPSGPAGPAGLVGRLLVAVLLERLGSASKRFRSRRSSRSDSRLSIFRPSVGCSYHCLLRLIRLKTACIARFKGDRFPAMAPLPVDYAASSLPAVGSAYSFHHLGPRSPSATLAACTRARASRSAAESPRRLAHPTAERADISSLTSSLRPRLRERGIGGSPAPSVDDHVAPVRRALGLSHGPDDQRRRDARRRRASTRPAERSASLRRRRFERMADSRVRAAVAESA